MARRLRPLPQISKIGLHWIPTTFFFNPSTLPSAFLILLHEALLFHVLCMDAFQFAAPKRRWPLRPSQSNILCLGGNSGSDSGARLQLTSFVTAIELVASAPVSPSANWGYHSTHFIGLLWGFRELTEVECMENACPRVAAVYLSAINFYSCYHLHHQVRESTRQQRAKVNRKDPGL